MKEPDNIFTQVVEQARSTLADVQPEIIKAVGKDKFMQPAKSDYQKRKEFDAMGQTGVIQKLAGGLDPRELVISGMRHLRGRK